MSSYAPVKLAYEVTEPEERANLNDLIFLHGVGHSNMGWKTLTKKFADHTGRRAYALDMRNHGDTEWSDDLSIDIMVKDVLHFMDEKGIKQAVLIGQSMGAKISMDLALAEPERVEKIVLEDLGPDVLSQSMMQMMVGWFSIMTKALEIIPPDASYKEANKMILDFVFESVPEELREKSKMMKPDPELMEIPLTKRDGKYAFKGNMNAILKMLQTEESFRASSGLCTKPALFIYGTLSTFKVNEQEELIMKLFPNAKLYAMEGATHTVHNEFPDKFCEVVFKFLSES